MITRTLGLMSTLVLVRLLAPEDFGLVALASGFTVSIEAFSWIGIEEGVIRHKSPTPALYDTAFTISALRGIVIFLLIAAAAHPGAVFFQEPRLQWVILALALSVLLETLTNIGTVEFRRDFTFEKEFQLFLLPRIASILLGIAVAAVFHTYWALIVSVMTNRGLRLLLSYTMHPYRPRLSLKEWRQLTGYSIWNSIIAAIGVIRDRSDTLMIGRLLNPTEVGVYSVGYEIAELPVTELISPLTRAAFTGFAAAQRSAVSAGETWLRLVTAMALLTLPAGVGMSAVAGPLIAAAFGPGWMAAAPVVQVLGFAFCLTVFGMVGQTLFLAHGSMRTSASITLASIGVRVTLLAVLIPAHGLSGAAVAAAVGIVTEQVLSAGFAIRGLGLSVWRDVVPPLWRIILATSVMGGALLATGLGWQPEQGASTAGHLAGIGGTALAGAAIYFATLAAAWLACGRPDGPERDILTVIRHAVGR